MYPCNFSISRMCYSASGLPITLKLIVRLCIGTTELCNCTYLQVYKPRHLFLINVSTQHLNQLGIYSSPGIYFQVLTCEIKPGVEWQVPLPILKSLIVGERPSHF